MNLDVRWRDVLRRQDWGQAAITVLCVLLPLVLVDNVGEARVSPFSLYDATIGLPNAASTIPYWVAALVPAAAAVASFAAGELLLSARLRASATAAAAAAVFFTLDLVAAALLTGLATDALKLAAGQYRPDFLDRCQPALPADGLVPVNYGEPASANAACAASADAGDVEEGRRAWPSGHASTAFVLATYAAAYCVWAAHWRAPTNPKVADALGAGRSLAAQAAADAADAAPLAWAVVQLGFAWAVAASRVVDGKHHPADVATGAGLGAGFALLFFCRAAARVARVADPGGGGGEGTPPRDTLPLAGDPAQLGGL